jgi:hypothetical protein
VELREARHYCLIACFIACLFIYTADGQDEKLPPNSPSIPIATITMKEREDLGRFGRNLPADFQMPADRIAEKLLKEYGAVFVCRGGCVPPKAIVFRDQTAVAAFQKSVESRTENIGGVPLTLQAAAMTALLSAITEARNQGLSITPRDVDSAARSYDDSVSLWASRVEPALEHWTSEKKVSEADAERIRALPPFEQVGEVLRLEKRKIYFAKDLKKSIIYSVAPPGTSQHLSMLAFDIREFDDPNVRSILAKHGWFQTVVSDLPHFTYLGVAESELNGLGLKKKKSGGRIFWVPDI